MGDRAPLTMKIVAKKRKVRKKAIRIFEQYADPEYAVDFDETAITVMDPEVSVGNSEEMAYLLDVLIEKGCELAYSVHEDPYYDYAGILHMNVPGVGAFRGLNCNGDGEPILTGPELDALIDEETDVPLAERIAEMTGRKVRDAFALMEKEADNEAAH